MEELHSSKPSTPIDDTTHTPQSPRTFAKSFASVCRGETHSNDVKIREPTTFKNLPAIRFSAEEVLTLSSSLKFALVGKLRKNPDLKTLRAAFLKLGLAGQFTIGALHPGFVLINLQLEEDYNRLWTKHEWYIAGTAMRLFKWTPDFELEKESSIAPIWVCFPHLPCHLYSKGALFSIASTLGNPLKLDEATASRIRPSMARVCIEIDLKKEQPENIWIDNGGKWFLQKVLFDNKPDYCEDCWHRGHTKVNCKSKEIQEKNRLSRQGNKKEVQNNKETEIVEKSKVVNKEKQPVTVNSEEDLVLSLNNIGEPSKPNIKLDLGELTGQGPTLMDKGKEPAVEPQITSENRFQWLANVEEIVGELPISHEDEVLLQIINEVERSKQRWSEGADPNLMDVLQQEEKQDLKTARRRSLPEDLGSDGSVSGEEISPSVLNEIKPKGRPKKSKSLKKLIGQSSSSRPLRSTSIPPPNVSQ